MLSLEQVRELIGPDCLYSDQQLQEEVDGLYALARALVSSYSTIPSRLPGSRRDETPPYDRDAFEERAGIVEYDAGLPRDAAERAALATLGHEGGS